MKKPELLLSNLNRVALELRGAIALLGDTSLKQELDTVIRRLFVAELLSKEWVVAIGGSQGAGKTTLLQLMYDLGARDLAPEQQWLPANAGRGECLPVLVVEDESLHEAKGFIRALEVDPVTDRCRITENPVSSPLEFRRATTGQLENVLIPVLRVPRRYFEFPGQAFLLLPGYEPQHAENQSWQALMRQALVGASACIVVTDQTRLANAQQRSILKDLQNNQLAGTEPIIVISKTENLLNNLAQQRELCQTAGDVFEIPESKQEKFILCTGSSPESIGQWRPRLASTLREVSSGSALSRQRQLDYLEQLVTQDLTSVLANIKTKFALHAGQADEVGVDVIKAIRENFDSSKKLLRREYKKTLDESLQKHFSEAWDCLDSTLIQDHEGFLNKVGGFFDTVGEQRRKLLGDIKSAWGHPGRFADVHTEILGQISSKKLGRDSSVPLATPAAVSSLPESRKALACLGYTDDCGKPVVWREPSEETRRNLAIVFFPGRDDDGESAQNSKELVNSIKLLPALTLEFARMSSLFPETLGVDPANLTLFSEVKGTAAAKRVRDDFTELQKVGSDVIKGLAIMLAIDGAADGKIQTIPALLEALGLGGGEAAAAGGLTLAGAATAMLAVGMLTYSVLQEVNRRDIQARSVAYAILEDMREQYMTHYLEHFDIMMDSVRRKMQDCLAVRYRLDETIMRRDRLAKAIADVASLKLDLEDQLGSRRAPHILTAEFARV